jgi:dihydrolipoamide dehydrogenase
MTYQGIHFIKAAVFALLSHIISIKLSENLINMLQLFLVMFGDLNLVESSFLDVAVIGAGIGGYVAAIRSAQLGKRVVLIEKDTLGGTCLNWGCIPAKTLLTTVNFLDKIKHSDDYGLQIGSFKINLEKIMSRKDAVVARLKEGINFLIRKNKIRLIEGKAIFLTRNKICVQKSDGSEEHISAKNIIIATGSEEYKPSYANISEEKILTVKGALSLEDIPESLTVIGGDIIGIELAVIFNALGSKVTILEASSNILPTLDMDLSRTYNKILKKKGIDTRQNTEVESINASINGKMDVTTVSKGIVMNIETEKVIVTNSRKPLLDDLGLEKIGVGVESGFIVVDEHMRTGVPNIYAVGDVTGKKMFAHVAAAGGIVAAENIAGIKTAINYKTVPICMYCSPEVASVGLSEEEAKKRGYHVAVGKFHLLANGRAITLGEVDGLAKVVCDEETGEVLGVHLVGPHATEIISEAALAIQLECTTEEIGKLIHPHPTISEALMEAARDANKKAIHI